MIKTKWTVEADQVTIFPDLQSRVIGAIFLVLVIAGAGVYTSIESYMAGTLLFCLILFGFAGLLCMALSLNKVVFDMADRKMRVKTFGVLTSKTVPFSDIAIISSVTQMGGGYTFNIFKKSNRHGKGIRISSAYRKDDDVNAEAMAKEVFPVLEREVFKDLVVEEVARVTSFKNYTVEDGVYTVKVTKVVSFLAGVAFIAMGVFFILANDGPEGFGGIVVKYFSLGMGLMFLVGITRSVSLNTKNRTIVRSLYLGLSKKEYSFDDFVDFSIVRKSTNFVYTGTEVCLVLKEGSSDKYSSVIMKDFRNTGKIEGFLIETTQLLNS